MIIDCGLRPPLPEFFKDFLELPAYLKGYEHLFGDRREEALRYLEAGPDAFLAELDTLGVKLAVISGKDVETRWGHRVPNETVSAFAHRYPGRFIGLAGADPLKGMQAVRDLEHAVRNLGLRGLALEPFEYELPANDKRYYPLYAKCVELGIPVFLHCSINFGRGIKMDYGRPLYLDEVAVHFPELVIIATTPGWPWVEELVGVAWRHPNVYIKIAAVRPLYLSRPGTGWEPLVYYGNSILQDRILFASAWPLLPLARTIEEVRNLPLKAPVKEKWLYRNAARLFGVEE